MYINNNTISSFTDESPWKIKNYPGPQEALNWWETAIRNTNGETSKANRNRGKKIQNSMI